MDDNGSIVLCVFLLVVFSVCLLMYFVDVNDINIVADCDFEGDLVFNPSQSRNYLKANKIHCSYELDGNVKGIINLLEYLEDFSE